MPRLRVLEDVSAWGDMIMTSGGSVFSIDADGHFTLSYGKPVKVNTNVPADVNEDGKPNTCISIAFAHLGLHDQAITALEQSISHSRLDEMMAGFEVIDWDHTVGDFINAHRTGSYFVVSYSGGTSTHAWALRDGVAFNINFQIPAKHIHRCWHIT